VFFTRLPELIGACCAPCASRLSPSLGVHLTTGTADGTAGLLTGCRAGVLDRILGRACS